MSLQSQLPNKYCINIHYISSYKILDTNFQVRLFEDFRKWLTFSPKRVTEPFLFLSFLSFPFFWGGEREGRSVREQGGRIFRQQLAAYRRLCGMWRRRLSPVCEGTESVRGNETLLSAPFHSTHGNAPHS